MAFTMKACLAFCLLLAAHATELRAASRTTANPVRKVVNLLQSMKKKVEDEGEREEKLYKQFMCYCKSGVAELEERVSGATNKIPQLESDIKAAEEKLVQAKADLKGAQTERSEAKAAIAAANKIRESEAKAFADTEAELSGYISQINGAMTALTNGMAGSLLQTTAASKLRAAVGKVDRVSDDDKEVLLSFLSGKASYAPKGGEVMGILKQLGDSMSTSLDEAKSAKAAAIKEHDALVAAKTKEVHTLTESIEAKMELIGGTGVSVVQMKADFEDLNGSLLEDKAMLGELKKGCSTKDAEYESRVKIRNEELSAIAETIKILNDDDALELFKKTLPAPSAASLVQVEVSEGDMRSRALATLQKAMRPSGNSRLGFLVLALRGKKMGFEKVVSMIDAMVVQLKKEQQDDSDKKDYCSSQLDMAEDSKKELAQKLSDTQTAIESAQENTKALAEGIAEAEAGIKALDKSVREATAIRKEENEEYKSVMQSNTAAKELLLFAKNRLNKFYNPKLYKPPAKEELSAQGAIERDMTFVQVSLHSRRSSVAPPPETWDAYAKKSEESNGVISMIDLLVADLDKDMQEAEVDEKNAQEEYDRTIADAKVDRVGLSKTLKEKSTAKADLTVDLETLQGTEKATQRELMANDKFTADLHAECDWLLQYFDVRAQARADEIDALGKAKAVLSGADYSLLQRAGALRRRTQ